MSRRITGHEANDFNRGLRIDALDEKGPGGAYHFYEIQAVPSTDNAMPDGMNIIFQKGTVPNAGVNGITEEALLAILIDRLDCFQKGDFACRENENALTHIETALLWLNKRTRDRLARGVEGTHTP